MIGVSSEAWEDLGYTDKPKEVKNPYRHFKSPAKPIFESSEVTTARRAINIAILQELKPLADKFEETDSCIQIRVRGKLFDFYPSSDCWFSHSKNQFGTGIHQLSQLIHSRLGVDA